MHNSARGPLFDATPPKNPMGEDIHKRLPKAPGSAPHRLQPLQAAAADEGVSKGITLRQLTKLEQRKMGTIAERQLTNRHQKQVVQRKEYQGAGFALKPSTASFDDFTVGAEHRCVIDLTNVSYTFNSFKVEALPPQLRAVLEVQYVPQSRMVAGKQASITVVFTPKEPVDVDGVITISTQTGVMELPVLCRTKRSKVVASTKVVDFGSVVVAESSSQLVTIRNEGALPTKLSIEGDALQLFLIEHTMVQASTGRAGSMQEDGTDTDQGGADVMSLASGGSNVNLRQGLATSSGRGATVDTPVPFAADGSTTANGHSSSSKTNTTQGSVRTCRILSSDPDLAGAAATGKPHTLRLAPFSETTITFNFTPLEICAFQSSLFLHLHDADSEDMVLFVKGESVAVPVFVSENSTIDFLSTYYDTLYRESFTVTNNTNATVKVSPKPPASLKGTSVVEFVPKFGFVQPHSTLSFQVKLQPTESALHASAQRLRMGTASTGAAASSSPTGGGSSSTGGILRFEELAEVHVSDQAMPLFVRLIAAISTRSLKFADPADGEVRLGAMYVDERSEVVVLLSNLAGVQRTAGFLQVPANIDILEPLPLPPPDDPQPVSLAVSTKPQYGGASTLKRAPRRTHMFQLLPLETLRVRLSIAVPGNSVGAFTQQLRVLTEHDDGASLTITGQGRAAPLHLTPSSVWFPPCAVGTHVETVVQLKNANGHLVVGPSNHGGNSNKATSSGVLSFDFLLLRRHGVQVTPQSGVLAPGESIPIRVRFTCSAQVVNLSIPPPIDFEAELAKLVAVEEEAGVLERGKSPDKKATKKRSKVEEEAELLEKQAKEQSRRDAIDALCRAREQEINQLKKLIPWERTPPQQQGSGAEPWALFRTLLIPCVFKLVDNGDSVHPPPVAQPSILGGATAPSAPVSKPIFLEVRCTVVKPTLTVRSDDTPSVGDRLIQPPRLTAAALQPSKAAAATQQTDKGAQSPGKSTLNVPIGKSGRTKSTQSLGGISAGTKKSGGGVSGATNHNQSAVVAEEERLMAEQLRAQLEAAEDEARRKEAELKSALTPVTTLDFGSVPSQHAVTKTFTIYHERFPAKIQRFIQEHLFTRALGGAGADQQAQSPATDSANPAPQQPAEQDDIQRVSSAGPKPPLPSKVPQQDADPNTAKARELLRGLPSMRLTVKPLEPGGVYTVSRPPLPILRPFQSTEVSVTFEPRQDALYKQSLEIVCDVEAGTDPSSAPQVRQYTLIAHLSGRGKPAALRIIRSSRRQASADPGMDSGTQRAGSNKGKVAANKGGGAPTTAEVHRVNSMRMDLGAPRIGDDGEEVSETPDPEVIVGDFGTCCTGDVLEQYFDLGNCSDFPLKVNTATVSQTNRNSNGTSPFWVADAGSHIVVPPRTATAVRLCFTPTVVGSFGCDMRVSYGGSGAFHTLRLLGNCAERPVYVVPPHTPLAVGVTISDNTDPDAVVEAATATHLPTDEESPSHQVGRLAVAHTPAPARRNILGDALGSLPTAAVVRPGCSPQNPLVLTFTTTAVRDYRGVQASPDPMADTSTKGGDASKSIKKADAKPKKSKGVLSGRSHHEDAAPTGDSLPRYNVISTTATHRFVVGTSRASTNRGEFAVVGLSSEAIAAGWGCSVVGFGSSCGEVPVAGEVAQGGGGNGGSGLAGPIGAVFGPLLGGSQQTTTMSKAAQQEAAASTANAGSQGMVVKGVIPPKSAAVVEITFTPTSHVLESLPLEGVDITSVATIRFLTKGGGTGPIAPVSSGGPSTGGSPSLQRRGSMYGTPRNQQQTQASQAPDSGADGTKPASVHPFGDVFGYLDAEGSVLSNDTSAYSMGLGADGGVLFVQLKAVVQCDGSTQ